MLTGNWLSEDNLKICTTSAFSKWKAQLPGAQAQCAVFNWQKHPLTQQ